MTTLNRQQPGDPAWLVEALKLDGLKERPGADHNPEILRLFADAGHPDIRDDETAWCAAFVGAVLHRAGYLSTGSLVARDYLKFGHPVTEPRRGDLVIFPRGKSSWQAHVAFVAGADSKYVYAFGGNQSNAVNVTRYARANALGFRRPVATQLVYDVQAGLADLGFNPSDNIDGVMGPATKKAIAAYETAKGYAPFDSVLALHRHLLQPHQPDKPPGTPAPQPAPAPQPKPQPIPIPIPAPAQPSNGMGLLGWGIFIVVVLSALAYALVGIKF